MESLDMCLAGGLHELGLLEQFKLNTLIHHWSDVVGPIFAGHTRIIDIKPPKNCAQRRYFAVDARS